MPTAGHWMTISEAKTHIMRAAGISRAMARRALAAAIAEREVEVRGVVKHIEARGSTGWSKGFLEEQLRHGGEFYILPRLVPGDIDWHRSALKTPWEHRSGRWRCCFERLDARRADVDALWPAPAPVAEVAEPSKPVEAVKVTKRVREVLGEMRKYVRTKGSRERLKNMPDREKGRQFDAAPETCKQAYALLPKKQI